MANETMLNAGANRSRWRNIPWGIAVGLLVLPFVAMQFTSEVNWTGSDFIVMGVMLFTVCGLFELTAWMSDSTAYRGGVAAALLASFLTFWVNGAVGMIGNEGNPENLIFIGVILLALIGTFIVRFRAKGMGVVMNVAAAGQGLGALYAVMVGEPAAILIALFMLPWLLSAWLFRRAAEEQVSM